MKETERERDHYKALAERRGEALKDIRIATLSDWGGEQSLADEIHGKADAALAATPEEVKP